MKTKLKCTFELSLEATKGKKSNKRINKQNRFMSTVSLWFFKVCATMLVEFLIKQIMDRLFYQKMTIQVNSFLLDNL